MAAILPCAGKLQAGPGGLDAPSYGRILPVTLDDVLTLELSNNALGSLLANSEVAAWLHANGTSLCADLVPEVGGGPVRQAVSLAVPLCAAMGISEVSCCALVLAFALLPACVPGVRRACSMCSDAWAMALHCACMASQPMSSFAMHANTASCAVS